MAQARVGRIHHVQIAAPAGCERAARQFFGELLGLEEIEKPANLAARGGAWFRGDGFEIHVGVDPQFRPAKKAHVALQVPDIQAMRTRLDKHGVETWEDEPLPGFRRFYAADPFGNRMEFLQRHADGLEPRASS